MHVSHIITEERTTLNFYKWDAANDSIFKSIKGQNQTIKQSSALLEAESKSTYQRPLQRSTSRVKNSVFKVNHSLQELAEMKHEQENLSSPFPILTHSRV